MKCGLASVVILLMGWVVFGMTLNSPAGQLPEKALFILEGHKADVWSVAFHPDGKLLASADAEGVVIVWDTATGKEKKRLRFEGAVTTVAVTLVAFGSDGKTLYAAGPTGMQGWTVETGAKLPQWPDPVGNNNGGARSRVFSQDGRLFAAIHQGSAVRIWEVATGKKRYEHMVDKSYRRIDAITFHPDNKSLLLGGEQRTEKTGEAAFIDAMDLETGKVQAIYQGSVRSWSVDALAFVPGRKILAFVEGSRVSFLDLEKNQVDRVRADIFPCLAIRPDGHAFAAAGSSVTSISLYPMDKRKEGPGLRGHADAIKSLAFSSDGSLLASGSFDRTVRLWNVAGYLRKSN